jgi:hypothetical protein
MQPISRVLYSLYRGSPRHGSWVIACLEGAWPALVGETLTRVCRPCRFSGSTLVVEILDAAWEESIRSCQEMLLGKLREATGDEVRQIAFRIGGKECR